MSLGLNTCFQVLLLLREVDLIKRTCVPGSQILFPSASFQLARLWPLDLVATVLKVAPFTLR